MQARGRPGARLRGGGEAALQLGLVGLRLQVAVAGAHARLQPAHLPPQLLQLGLLLLGPARRVGFGRAQGLLSTGGPPGRAGQRCQAPGSQRACACHETGAEEGS